MMKTTSVRIGTADLTFETGLMAKQANGAAFARFGETAVLATVCCSQEPVEGLDYVPLQVEYNEKFYAAGKIPGGFLRREGRPKDSEILVSRLIDRPMRPLFSSRFKRDIQVVPTTVSADMVNPPDVIAMVAASAAVALSDIPFDGPIGAVRICLTDEGYVVNPTFEQIAASRLDIVVAGTEEGITMVEGSAKEVPESALLEAIETARPPIQNICQAIKKLAAEGGKQKLPLVEDEHALDVQDAIRTFALPLMQEACFVPGKQARSKAVHAISGQVAEKFSESIPEGDEKLVSALLEELEYEVVRASILDRGVRTDGRSTTDIRPITCAVDVLPRAHGSALFTRGETQSLAVTTLGTASDERLIDDIEGEKRYESFMLHYNFPPFSVGETGRLSTGRREIGHGHLAQRALEAVLPPNEEFPYTIRVVSEILESNGSSSMASVCGGTLSLLNAGVPIRKPVAGIAMGLVTDNSRTAVLSDILGEEDHLGDMDFKVAGTEDGITAFQMDIKIAGVSAEIMATALEQAKAGRMHILGIMNQTINLPVGEISKLAPRILTLTVDEDKIGTIIGQGGKTIKAISEKANASVNIDDTGKVTIYGKDLESARQAEEMIKGLVEEPEIGKVYEGTVKRIVEFGAFVEILPGKEGLCHISRLSRERVNSVGDVLKVGQEIPVKIIEIDRMGRLNLSYIDAIDPREGSPTEERPRHPSGRRPPPRHPSGHRDGGRRQ